MSLGIVVVLTFIINIFSRVEEIAAIISTYSPINQVYINILVSVTFFLIIIVILKKYYEQQIIREMANEICSVKYTHNFLLYLADQQTEDNEFNDFHVYAFVENSMVPRNVLLRLLKSKVFKLYTSHTIEELKEIFISNLYSKHLIKLDHPDNLARVFFIRKKYRHSWDDLEVFDDI